MSRGLLLSILKPSSIRDHALPRVTYQQDLGFTPHAPTTTLRRRISHDATTTNWTRRNASSSSSSTSSTTPPPKIPIVLEKPDKFRPPSHPQRLVNRRHTPPRQYPGPPLSEAEQQAQKTKRYPHMFPSEGTKLHRFLTNKWIHMWISLGTLTLLAIITLTQSFLVTSPFAHLVPPLSSLPYHPVAYVSEWLATIRMHVDYNSQRTAAARRDGILDAQKRRLYRRAHGMEDLDAEGEQGIDVRGLVAWDDGLTNRERREGGGRRERRTGRDVLEGGGAVGDPITVNSDIDGSEGGRGDGGNSPVAREGVRLAKQNDGLGTGVAVIEGMKQQPEGSAEQEHAQMKERFDEPPPTPKRRVKKWLGIWE